ncbi:MAG TPA: hypothetical protein VH054_07570 [Polyangiaceae bacterium]|nr:hypothetical protein [Polyangiaceae bacterium]
MSSKAALALALEFALAAIAVPARADAPNVDVTIDACVPVDASAVRRIVEIELGASEDARGAARVTVSCNDDRVVLRVVDAVTGKSLEREIAASALAERSKARLLALAIVELVSASWVELVVTPDPVVPPAAPRASDVVRRRVIERVRARVPALRTAESDLRAELVVRLVDGGLGPLAGGGLVFTHDVALARFRAEVDALAGSSSRPLGVVNATIVGGAVAAMIAPRAGVMSFEAGAGFRASGVWLVGAPGPTAASGGSVTGMLGGPFASLGAAVAARWFSAALRVEAGWAVVGVRGLVDGASPVDVAGGWIGGSAELGVRF